MWLFGFSRCRDGMRPCHASNWTIMERVPFRPFATQTPLPTISGIEAEAIGASPSRT